MKTRYLLPIVLLVVAGCSRTELTLQDGTHLIRTRVLDTEKIGPISYDARDGSFTMDGYESDTSRLIGVIERLTRKYEEMLDDRLAVGP